MQVKYEVTLKQLRANGACYIGYNKLVRALQGQEFTQEDNERNTYLRYKYTAPIPLGYILDSNGVDDALWCLRCMNKKDKTIQRDIRLLVVAFARQVQHLMQDQRSFMALDVAERHANGLATDEELRVACDAAYDAACDAAYDAAYAAYDAAYLACAAAYAACDAAYTTSDAACDAASDAAYAACNAASDAACVMKEKQAELLLGMLQGKAAW